MQLEARARELLGASEYISIATASLDGQPWSTPVTGVHDTKLNFYWSSWKEAVHSKNVRENPAVFITRFDSTRKRGDNHRRCLYIKASATEVEDVELIKTATMLLYGQSDAGYEAEAFLGDAQRRIYQACPEQVWLNDKSERELSSKTIKMRIEVPLPSLIELL